MIRPEIASLRKDYKLLALNETEVAANPIDQFQQWFNAVLQSEIEEPNAMTLATTSADGKPSARIVLLKSFDKDGFIFFTNYQSKKGEQLAKNSFAALVFHWKELERQVRLEGKVRKISETDSDSYFNSRPYASKISAWASPQSKPLKSRSELEEKVQQTMQHFNDKTLIRPPFWGGYQLQPYCIEFWQGRSNRLHDRIQYNLLPDGKWMMQRLAP